ncbi:MAG: tRNA dihydrouridine synthase DusB [Leptospiraceae bacterium]|nr:tRNA dihydrouridine synthase DusB [Leptospiraceae bacterium]MCP5498731.1 tRNA dihydrouridine synthase DusB [Leptospiraceae bacterium]
MLKIRNILINGDIALSPMAGLSDSPYRKLTRKMGSAFSFTEFVSADDIVNKSIRASRLYKYSEIERPLLFQIYGNNLDALTEAAKLVEQLGPDIIDLNMGCSTAKVSARGSGAGLLRRPIYAGKIIESLRNAVSLPVTAKIRLGWDKASMNYKELVRILEESGVEAISVHGRTKDMKYSGEADWESIKEIKQITSVPIFGNGDILSYSTAIKRKADSGVDLVLIGRGALGNPWIFSGLEKQNISVDEFLDVVLEHYNYMKEFYQDMALKLFRKHLASYCEGLEFTKSFKYELVRCENEAEFFAIMDKIRTIKNYSPSLLCA